MQQRAREADLTPASTPSKTTGDSRLSTDLKIDVDQGSFPLTPAQTPSPMRFNLSIDAPGNTTNNVFEATIKYSSRGPFEPHEHPLHPPASVVSQDSTPESEDSDDDSSASSICSTSTDVSRVHPQSPESLEVVLQDHSDAVAPQDKSSSLDPLTRRQPIHSSAPYRDVSFQKAIEKGKEIAGNIASVLQRCPDESAPKRLLEEAKTLSGYKVPVERVVGIVGNSGHGKSSLINSLLDVEGLAMTDSSGSAVTAFVIEYRHSLPRHATDYTIECTCLAGHELYEQLEWLLEDYRAPALIDQNELSAKDYESVQTRSQAAADIYEAAFSSIESFDLTLLNYDKAQKHPKATASAWLQRWADCLQWPAEMINGFWTATADSAETCHELTGVFQDRGLWPFIKGMSIYLSSPLLRDGLVLADLPGYHDVNFARVRAARQYQAKCNDVFVVADIKRAVDNPIVLEVIRENKAITGSAQKIEGSTVTVVCTHSADLSDKKKLEKLVSSSKLHEAKAKIRAIDSRGSASRREFQEVDHAYEALLIEARNQKVIADLRTKYADEFRDNQLPVFCVDNLLYSEGLSQASRECSGIPSLQEYAAELPAQALFTAANCFLESRIPALISSFQLWNEAIRAQSCQERRPSLPKSEKLRECLSVFENWRDDMIAFLAKTMERPIERKSATIRSEARSTVQAWGGAMHHSSIAAWFRNNGTHSTGAVGYKCWNTELISCLTWLTTRLWNTLAQKSQTDLESASSNVISRLELYSKGCQKVNASGALISSIRARKDDLDVSLNSVEKHFMKCLNLTRKQATTGSVNSFMVDYMLPVYREGAYDRGTGVTARRLSLLREHVGGPNFVDDHCANIHDALETLIYRTAEDMESYTTATIDAIETDVNTLRGPPVKKTLFQKFPLYAEEVNFELALARTKLDTVNEYAMPARVKAKQIYATA